MTLRRKASDEDRRIKKEAKPLIDKSLAETQQPCISLCQHGLGFRIIQSDALVLKRLLQRSKQRPSGMPLLSGVFIAP